MAATRRLSAIMFTDLVGSTQDAHTDERRALRHLAEQEQLLRPLFRKHGGREIKSTGDGFLVEFESALEATECAVEIQDSVGVRNLQDRDDRILLRIGIHLGDVERRNNDIFGDAVNIASRIESLAEPGGICLSTQVFDQVRNKLALELQKIGPTVVKGVSEPIGAYRVVRRAGAGSSPDSAHALPRLAVLPLANISPDPQDEFFADGLTEELISVLSNIQGLRVIARTSIVQYKGTSKPIEQIGRELSVGSVLEGSVRKVGSRLRITVQLIDVGTQEHTWSERYDRELDDVFAVQSAVAKGVAESLQLRLLGPEGGRQPKEMLADPDAYAVYLKGRVLATRAFSEAELEESANLLKRAIELSPGLAEAHAALSMVYALWWFQLSQSPTLLRSARRAAEEALRLDPRLAEAHVSMAHVLMDQWAWGEAEIECQKAIELSPSSAEGHLVYRRLLLYRGRAADSQREARTAVDLDPLSSRANHFAGTTFLYSGEVDEAIPFFRHALAINPNAAEALVNLGLALVLKGEIAQGVESLERGYKLGGRSAGTAAGDLAFGYARAGRPEKVGELLRAVEARVNVEPTLVTVLAGLYALSGDRDRAFEWLKRALDEHLGVLPSIAFEFWFESIRTDARFVEILRRMGLA